MLVSDPTIFAIKRYPVHDGPDIRTTIFFKGCPLSCWWCHDPAGISPIIEIISLADRCVACGYCADQCPEEALVVSTEGPVRDHTKCSRCGNCVEICPVLANEISGWVTSTASVMAEIEKDLPFYGPTGSGVTFSGGEPLMQPEFLLDLLKACGRLDIHRAVDTSGYADTETLLKVARHTDIFLFDLKLMDDDRHRLYTGVGNKLILTNITALAKAGHHLRIRLPLIPGVNDDDENIILTGSFMAGLPEVTEIDILPCRSADIGNYGLLSTSSPRPIFPPANEEKVQHVRIILERIGLQVRRGA